MRFAVRPFSDVLAGDFARINRQWIEEMYALEPVDVAQLADPRGQIVDSGGDILFVEDPDLGIVGTCGLLRTGPDEFELIKMAVVPEARGRGAGEFLLRAAIARAFAMGAARLFLLTNSRSAAAIRLYERNGFVRDVELLARCGGEYARCDVAMRYSGSRSRAIRQIAPQFFTTDLAATLAYYKDKLGFDCLGTWNDPPVYAIVARDGCRIHFRVAEPPLPSPDKYDDELLDAYLFIEDADALHAEYAARGVEFTRDLGDTPWHAREFVVRDCDGRLLAFGADPDSRR